MTTESDVEDLNVNENNQISGKKPKKNKKDKSEKGSKRKHKKEKKSKKDKKTKKEIDDSPKAYSKGDNEEVNKPMNSTADADDEEIPSKKLKKVSKSEVPVLASDSTTAKSNKLSEANKEDGELSDSDLMELERQKKFLQKQLESEMSKEEKVLKSPKTASDSCSGVLLVQEEKAITVDEISKRKVYVKDSTGRSSEKIVKKDLSPKNSSDAKRSSTKVGKSERRPTSPTARARSTKQDSDRIVSGQSYHSSSRSTRTGNSSSSYRYEVKRLK